jgi:hypothetical protein
VQKENGELTAISPTGANKDALEQEKVSTSN